MLFSTSEEASSLVLRIEGELDAVSVPELRHAIEQIVSAKAMNVVVDLSGLRLIDSSGVGAIVSLYKRVRTYGGEASVRGLRDQPLAIFRLLRLDRVLTPTA